MPTPVGGRVRDFCWTRDAHGRADDGRTLFVENGTAQTAGRTRQNPCSLADHRDEEQSGDERMRETTFQHAVSYVVTKLGDRYGESVGDSSLRGGQAAFFCPPLNPLFRRVPGGSQMTRTSSPLGQAA